MKEGSDTSNDSIAEALAEWRAAGRDTVAARAAARIAGLALDAARAAEEAANETETAVKAAAAAVDKALQAATSARKAALSAAEAARILLAGAEGDKLRANHEAEASEQAEATARDHFHDVEDRAINKD